MIGVFLERALKGKPIEIWGDGTNRRDYLYVKDMIDAVMKLMRHEEKERVFNISTGIGYSLNDIVKIIREELNIPVKVSYKSTRGFDVPENILSSKRLQNETGWKGTIGLVEGMQRLAEEKK